MPCIWRYLMGHFLKLALVCVLAFVSILLTMRLDEIANFIALGAPLSYILLFTFYQIPYILPIAIPLSCLIAVMITIQRLSNTHELMALRACGFALKDILAPLLIAASFLTLVNFWMVSEAATHSYLMTNMLKNELRSINPLFLLNNKHLMSLKGIYSDALGPTRVGEYASDVILAIPNKNQNRLNLLIAKKLQAAPDAFKGEKATLITTLHSTDDQNFDSLLIENMGEFYSPVQDFSQLLQKKVWVVNNDYLKMSLLLARIQEQKAALEKAQVEQQDKAIIKQLKGQLSRSWSEIARRLSIAIAVFSFTLLGATFGFHVGRQRNYRGLIWAIILTVIYLISFFIAKGADQNWILAYSLYLIPPLLLIFASLYGLRRISQGKEPC